MHISSMLAALAAVQALAGASPFDLPKRNGGDEDAVTAIGGGAPQNLGLSGPVGQDQCFYARAIDGRPGVIGKWLDGHHAGLIHFHESPKQADLWALDKWGQLRLAYEGSVVWRDPIPNKPYGPAKTRPRGQKKCDDKVTCDTRDGLLRCQAYPGDQTLSEANHFLYIGQSPVPPKWTPWKRNLWVEPVKIEIYPHPCPGGKQPWGDWD